jgi:hypothetical protein
LYNLARFGDALLYLRDQTFFETLLLELDSFIKMCNSSAKYLPSLLDNIALGVTEAELYICGPIADGAEFKEVVVRGKLCKNGFNSCQLDTRPGHPTASPIYALLVCSDNAVFESLMI